MTDLPIAKLPDSLKPIKPIDWKNACDWIRARWGRTNWEDDTVLFEDAMFWCKEELDGGLQYILQKGGDYPPTFAEVTKQVKEWRGTHLANRLAEFNKALPPERGSLEDYLQKIGAESFAHACYLATQERAKYNKLEKYEDKTLYNNWTQEWKEAKATYMIRSQKLGKSEFISPDSKNMSWEEIVAP